VEKLVQSESQRAEESSTQENKPMMIRECKLFALCAESKPKSTFLLSLASRCGYLGLLDLLAFFSKWVDNKI
jgi:hypothetical protein